MENNNTLAAIMGIARSNEEKGSRFYAAMAKKAVSEKIKHIFKKLSAEELEHKAAFDKILKAEADSPGDVGEEEGRLLEALMSTSVFHKISGDGQEVFEPLEALAIGIQAEKDSILLYQGIFSQSKSQAVKNLLSILLEEEKRHLVELRESIEELQENSKR